MAGEKKSKLMRLLLSDAILNKSMATTEATYSPLLMFDPLKQHHSARHFTAHAKVEGEMRRWMSGLNRDFDREDVDN